MKKFVTIIVFAILLLEVQLFSLLPYAEKIQKYNNPAQKYIIVIIIIATILVLNKRLFINKKYLFHWNVIIFVVIYLEVITISLIKYNQTIRDLMINSSYCLVILAYFIFSYYLKDMKNLMKFKNIIIIMSTIISILYIIQSILYKSNKIFLLIDLNSFRFESLRINQLAEFICLGAILAYSNLINNGEIKKKWRLIGLVAMIVNIYEIIFVAKIRALLLIIIFTFLIMTFIRFRKEKKIIIAIPIVILLLGVFYKSPIFNQYIELSSADDYSLYARSYEINYYMRQFYDNPIFGMGFMVSRYIGDENYYIARGPLGIAHRSDVGIIGFINTFGIVGIIWYIHLLVKCLYYILKLFRKNEINKNIEVLGIFLFVILGSSTLIIMDPYRIIILPIFISIIDSVYNKSRYNLEKVKRPIFKLEQEK